jgi:hypothetical protein
MWGIIATGLKNVIVIYINRNNLESAEPRFKELFDLAKTHPNDEVVDGEVNNLVAILTELGFISQSENGEIS